MRNFSRQMQTQFFDMQMKMGKIETEIDGNAIFKIIKAFYHDFGINVIIWKLLSLKQWPQTNNVLVRYCVKMIFIIDVIFSVLI